jgi:CubicO group peptidase (beta-lactamase class C family)
MWLLLLTVLLLFALADSVQAGDKRRLSDYFPPAESKGGWRSALPEKGDPDATQKAAIAKLGVDFDKLKDAWSYNARPEGATALIVIRQGTVVGEWYKDSDQNTPFNIYSSSKAYTSLAYGLLLSESAAGRGTLTLDTKVGNRTWLPESLPLSDPRKAYITVRHLLNMTSGVDSGSLPIDTAPFEIALGRTKNSPFAKLKSDPGEKFLYSDAGVAHLVLLFNRAAGQDLQPYLKERVFSQIGMANVTWTQIGGKGKLGPLSQGYSGVLTTPREHARFCYLALHKGEWDGRRVVPESHFDFAWTGTKANPMYGAQWWVYPRHPDAPVDLVQTSGAFNNIGFVLPSLDLVFIRLGDGKVFPDKDFSQQLLKKVLAAVKRDP